MKGYTRILKAEYRRLSMLEHGAYALIVDACYEKRQFPTRDMALAWALARTSEQVEAVDFVLSFCFKEKGGLYVCADIEKDLKKSAKGKAEVQKDLFAAGPGGHEFIRIPAAGGKQYSVSDGDVAELIKLYPGVNVEQALREIRDWNSNNTPKTLKGMPRHIKSWLSRESKRVPAQRVSNPGQAMTDDWRPSEDAYRILSGLGVERGFAEDEVPEFVLFWKQTGQVRSTWDSAFICRVRSQHDRKVNSKVKHDEQSADWTELLSGQEYSQLSGGGGSQGNCEQGVYRSNSNSHGVAAIRTGRYNPVGEALQIQPVSRSAGAKH